MSVLIPGLAAASPEERYAEWTHALVAPCCWHESLATHRSPAAEQARGELRALLQADRSDDEIRETFVARYGTAILITPDGARGQWLFVTPILTTLTALAVGALILAHLLRRRPRRKLSAPDLALDDADWDW